MSSRRSYWFAPGGQLGAAVVRIAIAISVLATLSTVLSGGYAATPESAPLALYRPAGVWLLWGRSSPPAWLVSALAPVAWISTVAMLLGAFSRISTAISFVSAVALAAYDVSFTATWSHHNNLPFLAQLAFLGARSGDALSVDALWRRWRKRSPPAEHAGYQWSLRLAQLAVALMFLGAALAKLYFGGGTPAWAFSDNLRHQLLARFDWIGVPRTPVAQWLIDDVWRYRSAALLNLCVQAMSFSGVFLVHRPWARLGAGIVFAIEVVALGFVMDLWNLHWLPLVAVFVDWDYFFGRRPAAPIDAVHPRRSRWVLAFITAFVLYDAVVVLGLDQRLRTYPFSAYPMFGMVRAKQPYDRHLPYDMPGAAIELVAAQPVTANHQLRVDSHYTFRRSYQVRSAAAVEAQLRTMLSTFAELFPELTITGVRLHLASYRTPAYPAKAELRQHRLGVLGELRAGAVLTALGRVRAKGDTLVVTPLWQGITPRAPVTYRAIVDYAVEVVALEQISQGAGGEVVVRRPPGDSVVVLAEVGGVPYVVGEVGKRRW